MNISIIIPTLNEEAYLRKTILHTLEAASDPDSIEFIVVDAGSKDQTIASVDDLNLQTYLHPEFALQKFKSLNLGIEKAAGEVLIFLDADTSLPDGFDSLIKRKLTNPNVVGGAFEFSFRDPDWKLWLLQVSNRIRYRFGQIFYGDQAIFCMTNAAKEIGGYPQKKLMESAYFCQELKKVGTLTLIKSPVSTSPRRFNENGFFKSTWFDIMMWLRFVFKLPVDSYGAKYWGVNLKSDG